MIVSHSFLQRRTCQRSILCSTRRNGYTSELLLEFSLEWSRQIRKKVLNSLVKWLIRASECCLFNITCMIQRFWLICSGRVIAALISRNLTQKLRHKWPVAVVFKRCFFLFLLHLSAPPYLLGSCVIGQVKCQNDGCQVSNHTSTCTPCSAEFNHLQSR